MERLATFVHVSDLHVGDVHADTGEVSHPLWLQRAWTECPAFTGLAGHDLAVVEDLVKCWESLRSQEDARLIVTGDLTAYGSAEQYDAAVALLGSESEHWHLTGLSETNWRDRAILGNHDRWGGTFLGLTPDAVSEAFLWVLKKTERWAAREGNGLRRAVGLASTPLMSVFRQMFRRPIRPVVEWLRDFPEVSGPFPLPGAGVRVRWLTLDSDAEVFPSSPHRLLARGSFCRQLERLQARLEQRLKEEGARPDPPEIRVLLLHHSPGHPGVVLGIDQASRQLLKEFITKYRVRVLLTGHIHVVALHHDNLPVPLSPEPRKWGYLEARCGATTQVARVPLTRPDEHGRWYRELDLNTFLVHRLLRDGGRILWETQVYRHVLSARTFQEAGQSARLVVWPPDA